ncbi:Bacteriohemerythrin [Tepidimonas alkaliphilus]|uniref:Bacteriohemerythrin n=1 Tax=Tepidimonas alkaliphilus TaxID=2588942 RepID=A0A554W487_9BURK|nr:hemerythrin domain-containing protein [Tepidimonas alkaliphilus]TSE18381.1 Bacteriohemerythrin [Tepidimonas alkaliphilus]
MAEIETHPEVPPLAWSAELATGDACMDETHQEFVTQLAALRALPPQAQLEPYRALIAHTEAHFAREERWMVAVGFAPDNCHARHHREILDMMRAVERHYLDGDTDIIARMAAALAEWFPTHAQTMDAGLAQHMRTVGFDSRTERLADPSRVRPATMTGCGSVHCR